MTAWHIEAGGAIARITIEVEITDPMEITTETAWLIGDLRNLSAQVTALLNEGSAGAVCAPNPQPAAPVEGHPRQPGAQAEGRQGNERSEAAATTRRPVNVDAARARAAAAL